MFEDASVTLDDNARAAAVAIHSADVLLFHLGAGMGVDSGLATYNDVARFEAYAARGVDYAALCNPRWLDATDADCDPSLFWGFWGHCHNSYRAKLPHPGYDICAGWKRDCHDRMSAEFGATYTAAYESLCRAGHERADARSAPRNTFMYAVALALFCSPVDDVPALAASVEELYEIHGSFEGDMAIAWAHAVTRRPVYQCTNRCSRALWYAPSDYTFDIDQSTMLAKPRAYEPTADFSVLDPQLDAEQFSQSLRGDAAKCFSAHSAAPAFPKCPVCGSLARPAICMFDDMLWTQKERSRRHHELWWGATFEALAQHDVRVVIVEVGCGTNVPSVRMRSETIVRDILLQGRARDPLKQPVIIRINPDFPTADSRELRKFVLPLQTGALAGLRLIERHMDSLKLAAHI